MFRLCSIAVTLLLTVVASTTATADEGVRSRELYIAGWVGGSMPHSVDLEEDDIPRLRRVFYDDVRVDGSATFGASFGEWHINSANAFTWGFRLDVGRHTPSSGLQDVRLTGSSDGTEVDRLVTLEPTESTVASVIGNVLASGRHGARRGRGGWAFHLGGGAGVERWELRLADGSSSISKALAFQAVVGGEIFANRRWSGFGEYRFTTAGHTFKFGTSETEARVGTSQLIAGVSFHLW